MKLIRIVNRVSRIAQNIDSELEKAKSALAYLNDNFKAEDYDEYTRLRRRVHELEFMKRNGYPSIGLDDRDEFLKDMRSLNEGVPNHQRENMLGKMQDSGSRWRKSREQIGHTKKLGPKYKVEYTGGVLYRGVTLEDWNRIKEQGYIDTDGRGAIEPEDEQINLTPHPETAVEYIPSGHRGVVLAIDPNGLDLFMIGADDYIRANGKIPLSNVVKVSGVIGKDIESGMYLPKNEVPQI